MSNNNIIAADTDVINTQVFFKQLDRLMGASIGVIAIRTREMERAKTILHEWSSMRGMDFRVWNRLRGFQTFKSLPVVEETEGVMPTINVDSDKMDEYLRPVDTLKDTLYIDEALEHYQARFTDKSVARNRFCGVFVAPDETEMQEPKVQQHLRDHVQRAYECDDRIFLLLPAGSVIPEHMVGEIELLDMSPPSFVELSETLHDMSDNIAAALDEYVLDDDGHNKVVQNALGMTSQEFENAVSLAIVDIADRMRNDEDFEPDADAFVKVVRMRKLEILKQTQTLELLPEGNMASVGGFDKLKASLQRQKKAFGPEAKEFGILPPKGFVAVGPPGSGKSLLCKAVSHTLGLPAILFNFSSVFNALVGSSESRLRMCLQMLEDMSPCIAFIDEIDKALAGGDNDGGVSKRILGILLTWMQEKSERGKMVYVIASANDVSNFPPELIRKGRFDDIWGLGFPSEKERADIFKIHVEKRGHKLTADEYRKLAKETDNYVGSEIESIVAGALLEDFYNDSDNLTFATTLEYARNMTPQSKAFPAKIKAMKDWIEANAKPASSTAVLTYDGEDEEGKAKLGAGITQIKRKPTLRKPRSGLKSNTN